MKRLIISLIDKVLQIIFIKVTQKPATSPFNDKIPYIKEPKLTKQNIEQAKTLLAKDGYTKDTL